MAYLGEREVDLSTDENCKNYSKADWVMLFIEMYGQIDGQHHQRWLLDRIARILNGAKVTAKIASWTDYKDEYRFSVGSSKKYEKWVVHMLGNIDEDGEYEYHYDEGSPP